MVRAPKALVTGVANRWSIAWGIAKSLSAHGAEVILSCQNENMKKRAAALAGEINCPAVYRCDLVREEEVATLFDRIRRDCGELDILVHSVAFAPPRALEQPLTGLSLEDFFTTFHASVYTLLSLSRQALPLMSERGGSILTLTHLGAHRVMPGYGIMGPAKAALECTVKYLAAELGRHRIRVNAISAGPVKTISTAVFADFHRALEVMEEKSPLRSNISPEDVGELAAFLTSEKARLITGAVVYVDSGAHIVGV